MLIHVLRAQTHLQPLRAFVLGLGSLALAAGAALAVPEMAERIVSQKGRAFQPNAMTLHRNDSITIVNDDSDLLHHAYIEASSFEFDSGDQLPGSHTTVTFTKSGVFQVLCGIHPKMKLTVRVD